MNIAKLVFAFIRRRPLSWAFHVLTLALGVAVVVAVILLNQALDRRFASDLAGVDLVVGAKGSPLQLIMSSLFQIDFPTGNIPLAVAEKLAKHPLVAQSAMISLGDNVKGLRIVGTSPAYAGFYQASLDHGAWWTAPLEVVLGSESARILGLDVGGSFVGQHGLTGGGEMHSEFPYRIVGVLKPTGSVIDRLVLTGPESVWRIHEHEAAEEAAESGQPAPQPGADTREVTALLLKYKSSMGAVMLPNLVKAMPDIQGAVPALEAARLNVLLGTGADLLRWFGIGLLILSALGFVIALSGAVQQRQRELALLRVLGARRALLLGTVVCEALLLGVLGGLAGALIGRGLAGLAAGAAADHGGLVLLLGALGPVEALALLAAAALSLVAALIPSLIAYRLDAAEALRTG